MRCKQKICFRSGDQHFNRRSYCTGDNAWNRCTGRLCLIRLRNNANPAWYINFLKKHLLISSELGAAGGVAEYDVLKAVSDNGKTTDYTKNGNYYVSGVVMLDDGTINSSAGNDWLAYYLPVSAGDKVTMSGIYGSATVGQQMAYFIQLDSDKNFVSHWIFIRALGPLTSN